ncbi:coiled-coil domain-containing protein 102A isoform X1 [Culicoides brevitarsis]|uniref:coiled-coil domain-containing protein 102A isoform X1 n=1 Tax=Culicoides brevitarsis TaxID=469753 RepID=UPI00307B7CA0
MENMSQNISASLGVTSRTAPTKNILENASSPQVSSEWDIKESQRQRELEEARARAAQMEKTMKWWSDCTQNWREKWSKVRTERNKARDEVKQLRASLETAQKDVENYKREMEKLHLLMLKHAGQFKKEDDNRDASNGSPDISSDGMKNVNSEDGLVTKVEKNGENNVDLLEEALAKHSLQLTKDEQIAEERRLIQQLSKEDQNEDFLLEKVTTLQNKLDEAQKGMQLEREEKNALHKNFEKLRHEFHDLRSKCEDLRQAKQEAVRELLTLQETHRAELRIANNSLQEEVVAREALEKRICDLRTELEKLQAENAAEWGKRERLETEKLTMDRENKKLRSELQDLQDRLERKGRPITNTDAEIRTMQQDLADKTKELADVKHSNNKMKKMLTESNTELQHAVRRAEQYETEVKRLRTRVEELKRELAAVEDELDSTLNHVKRLQRQNEELTQQNEHFQVQMQHLHSRNNTASPNKQFKTKIGFPHEYKPNIHELKQLFDDTKRSHISSYASENPSSQQAPVTKPSQKSHQRTYSDAKPTLIESDLNSFDMRMQSRNNAFNFERAKQKFDNSSRSNKQPIYSVSQKQAGSFIPKRNSYLENNYEDVTSPGFNDEAPIANSKGNYSMTSSINLDGLKVSDDE